MANQETESPESGELGETPTNESAPFNSFQLRRLRKRLAAGEVVPTDELRQAYRYLMGANTGESSGAE